MSASQGKNLGLNTDFQIRLDRYTWKSSATQSSYSILLPFIVSQTKLILRFKFYSQMMSSNEICNILRLL